MKIAVAGKGGVGKTTLAATLAHVLAEGGRRVLAIDADPDANLASALGVSDEDSRSIVPIAKMRELVAERTGSQGGGLGGFFRLNPRVEDLPERLSLQVGGVRLMVLGGVETGGSGCICPESSLLRALVGHLLLDSRDVVVLDMEAGLEHLGRGTAGHVDVMLVVVEPGARSARTAARVRELASELGVGSVHAVLNKVGSDEERSLTPLLGGMEIIGRLPYSAAVLSSDLDEVSAYAMAPDYTEAVRGLALELTGLFDDEREVAP